MRPLHAAGGISGGGERRGGWGGGGSEAWTRVGALGKGPQTKTRRQIKKSN